MTISLSSNLFFAIQLKTLRRKVISSNTITSVKLESAVRDTMYSIKELNKVGTKEAMTNLQSSVQQLVLIFNNWIDLNQLEENPNESLMKGLSALETLRNTIVRHLGNQYSSNHEELTDYDIVLLDKIYEKLDRLLVIYNNIEGRIGQIKNIDKGDGGLSQWASNIEEISKLYRHSRIPNEHPKYIQLESALTRVDKIFPELINFQGSKEVKESVQIKDGVHYYEIGYYNEGELNYLVWIDALDGSLRHFEDYTESNNDVAIFQSAALNSAKNFMDRFETYEQIVEGVSTITDENTKNIVYAFQFTPVLEKVAMVSDCVNVNVSSKGGKVIKYSSYFSNTKLPSTELKVPLEDIEEEHADQLVNMKYNGLSVVRSFYTHYRPVVTYNYKSTGKDNITKLYFDVATGSQVYESYSVYEPVSYITADENF